MAGLERAILCYVTDRRTLKLARQQDAIATLLTKIQGVISAGVDWVQVREKDLSAKELALLTRQAVQCAATVLPAGSQKTRILVNDRIDVAITGGAGGVHLGEKSLGPEEAREVLRSSAAGRAGDDFLIGVSCHSLQSAQRAEQAGADYVFFGPVFATPSKSEYGAPQGLARLEEVCRCVKVPVLAIGGITLENAASCRKSGAKGVVAIRLFQDAIEPAAVVRKLRALLS